MPTPSRHLAVVAVVLMLAAGVVPRAFADNAASSCVNTTVNNDASNTCYTITPPLTDGSGITIDGNEVGLEWSGAKTKNLTGDFSGSVKVLRSTDAIWLLITANDPGGYDPSDQIRVFFDPLHNHATATEDIEFRIVRDTGGSPNHRKIVGAADNAWNPATLGSQLGKTSTVGAWVVELKLTAAELGLSDLPPVLGFGIQVEDNPNNDLSLWPANFNNLSPATAWANLKTRFPIEYVLVLDRSGSMLSQSKWDNAKKAANFFANTMSILREATYFTDQIGAVTFSYSCSGATNETAVNKPLASIGAFPLGNWTDSPPALPAPGNCTPIGRGLDSAFSALGTGAEETQRVVLTLSDGLHNRPGSEVPLLPTHLSYNPCGGAIWTSCPTADHRIQVNTVALGEDWGVDTALLNNIKNHFAGAFASTYNIMTNVEDLKEAFIGSLDNLYQMNLAAVGASGSEFTVNANERKLIVILSWTNPASAVGFSLQRKVNPADPWGISVACNASGTSTAVGFAICAANEPPAGTWRAVDGMGNPLASADRQFVLLDLDLRARFGIDQVVHGTGMDIVLTADLRQAGKPVTNAAAHPVKATVHVARPGEGFGTVASTTSPQDCRRIEPQLPRTDAQIAGTTTNVPATSASAGTGSGDPGAVRFALMQQLLKACGKDGLARVEDPGLELFDDGTHGDATADDGVYTLRFANTQYEGSYVFRFNVDGQTPDGRKFTRTKRSAEYVRVEVDAGNTTFGAQLVSQVGNVITRQYYVTPRDKGGEYLGPGYPEQVQFFTSAGQWLGPVVDYNNGIYSRVLRYDRTRGEPAVTPVVQGSVVGTPAHLIPWWLCLLIILILIVIIILLWLRLLRK